MIEALKKKLSSKAQTSLEILIVMGGLIIIAVVVVTIILASSKNKVTEITTMDKANTEIIDKSLFPPNLNSLQCTFDESTNEVNFNISVIPSITKDISQYCLVINGKTTEECVSSKLTDLQYSTTELGTGNYKISLVSKNSQNAISSSSVAFSCSVDVPTTPIIPGGEECTGTLNFSCPEGYIKVPGNSELGTTNGSKCGFCVMKWEAKVDIDRDGIGDTNNQYLNCTTYFYMWKNTTGNLTGVGFTDTWGFDGNSTRKLNENNRDLLDTFYKSNDCSSNQRICDCNLFNYSQGSDYQIVSSGEGQPIGRISMTDAKKLCENISINGYSGNFHLITNNEWMTIANNIEQQSANWVGGINTGIIKKGNTCNYNGSRAVTYTVGEIGIIDRVGSTSTGSNRTGTSPAKLVVNNGESDENREIWDFSGNMWEWVDKTVIPFYGPEANGTTKNWFEFNEIRTDNSWLPREYKPLNSNLTSGNGIGKIYLDWTSQSTIGLLRGGFNFYSTSGGSQYLNCGFSTGIYSLAEQYNPSGTEMIITSGQQTLNLKIQPNVQPLHYCYHSYVSDLKNSVIGFRCAYTPQ